MSKSLVTAGEQRAAAIFNPEQIELVKNTVAKGATDDELKMFMYLSNTYGLDPFKKEIWFIKRAKKVKDGKGNWDYPRDQQGKIDYSQAETIIMTSRDGYLKVAQQNPNFEGLIAFPVREGDTFEIDASNYSVTHKFGAKRGNILGAWARLDMKGARPFLVYVEFCEYKQDTSNTWKQYPSAMIQKVAEVFVLKRGCNITGLVTQEEVNTSSEDFSVNYVVNETTADMTGQEKADIQQSGENQEPQGNTDPNNNDGKKTTTRKRTQKDENKPDEESNKTAGEQPGVNVQQGVQPSEQKEGSKEVKVSPEQIITEAQAEAEQNGNEGTSEAGQPEGEYKSIEIMFVQQKEAKGQPYLKVAAKGEPDIIYINDVEVVKEIMALSGQLPKATISVQGYIVVKNGSQLLDRPQLKKAA